MILFELYDRKENVNFVETLGTTRVDLTDKGIWKYIFQALLI